MNAILLDAGHGGKDPGASFPPTGIPYVVEKALNLQCILALADTLQEQGYQVHLTRATDCTCTPDQRRTAARKEKADIAISIHHNAGHPLNRGPVLFALPQDRPLLLAAEAHQLASPLLINPFNKQPKYLDTSPAVVDPKHWLARAHTALQRIAVAPALLIECGYLTNAIDREAMLAQAYTQRVADWLAPLIVHLIETLQAKKGSTK